MNASSQIICIILATVFAIASFAAGQPPVPKAEMDDYGVIHILALNIPYSDLASPEARKDFIDQHKSDAASAGSQDPGIEESRREVDEYQKPGFHRLVATFPVDIKSEVINGVPTKVITPKSGVEKKNKNRVLINLHGGGMQVAWTYGAQEESIPIASLSGIKVITVNYRMAPEWHFPAAQEDIANVYRELLKSYRPENIGIYGCSAGAYLTGSSVAWFQSHGLPRPGAIGLFGWAPTGTFVGDSSYITPILNPTFDFPKPGTDPYFRDTDPNDSINAPIRHDDVLRKFPPSLLISGSRDIGLSPVIYAHSRLVDLGVEASLHVWEGAPHCGFAQGLGDPNVPENRQAWNVIVRFFEKHLATAK